jgi:hypothetical protein
MPRTKVIALIVRSENAICVPVPVARENMCPNEDQNGVAVARDGICGQSAHHGDC